MLLCFSSGGRTVVVTGVGGINTICTGLSSTGEGAGDGMGELTAVCGDESRSTKMDFVDDIGLGQTMCLGPV